MEKNLQFVDSYHEKNYVELVQNFMGKLNKDLYIVLKLLSINEVYVVAKEYIIGTNIMFKELLNDSRIVNTSRFLVELAYSFFTRQFSVNEISSTRNLSFDTRNFIINIINYYSKMDKEENFCA
ncbi:MULTISPECIES: hypothetical protein [unclassified Clostridium]|uniref:hypothetical protein n=1 Tax=Clostridium TaxID=1485 RepID=UPI001C8C36B7|nr:MULTISPECIES: hypothetical protein [unclassified Clostridium]MBX9136964.1 hypothetical protein [Clostridium sp. K12(2020)]MBX9143718.1 hypothetical protein [Clostridium sp. K13]MDU2291869.1 hypothetical protein [Clostridium celatum]MDU4326669.1 hypothetical protein [Clostridium celatum]